MRVPLRRHIFALRREKSHRSNRRHHYSSQSQAEPARLENTQQTERSGRARWGLNSAAKSFEYCLGSVSARSNFEAGQLGLDGMTVPLAIGNTAALEFTREQFRDDNRHLLGVYRARLETGLLERDAHGSARFEAVECGALLELLANEVEDL